ncbi:MAG: hypothetical protein V2I74_09480, partial [Erythrobacter sp.]|nr:hypothetical protein [Erythrobacter sp.]
MDACYRSTHPPNARGFHFVLFIAKRRAQTDGTFFVATDLRDYMAKEELLEMRGRVVELLPNAMFRV